MIETLLPKAGYEENSIDSLKMMELFLYNFIDVK